jgi:RNase P subunit RPR2
MKPFTCRHCRQELAKTDGVRLVMPNGTRIGQPVMLECPACNRRTLWRPLEVRESVCYTVQQST